ncbi:MAG TPA: endonuclease MutS2, partial [Myxococcota bacterium]|nr:endonuclease MutS2 [Myxococcota bacterium]
MSFTVAQSTLESLEWSRILDALRMSCRTPQGRLRLEDREPDALFETSEEGVRARLRETSEARALLDRDERPPLGGCADLRAALAEVARGSLLEPLQLLDVRMTLEALQATKTFFERRVESCPTLASESDRLDGLPEVAGAIARCIDPGGEVRDAASTSLAQARREARKLAGDLQSRIERTLQHADVSPHLSDRFYTVRSGRYVLPVKADARGRVRGIVHDASRSGTTLYVEPEAMVELNNRHRQAELTIEREIARVLRELSTAVARHGESLDESLQTLARIDLALARGDLSRRWEAVEPRVGSEGIFDLPGLRHPLIPPDQCVANDLAVGRDFSVLILSGPNAGGKTVALKSIALAALLVRAGLHVPAAAGARVDLVGCVLADIGDHQDIQESLSTFSAAMSSLAAMLRGAGPDTLACLDEIGVGTDPSEGAAIAQATLEALASSGARTVTTTHYNLLKEMAEVDERFENASVEFDPETLAPTYRIRLGAPGASSAAVVAARMGVPRAVLDRASALLDREDRQLDRMLAELAASRALLETEKATAEALRREGEQLRDEYRARLARLQERRDALFEKMRNELDVSFRAAHGEVARIIAELQRQPGSRRAAVARDRLEALRQETEQTQSEQGLLPESPGPSATESAAGPVDWSRIQPGDP